MIQSPHGGKMTKLNKEQIKELADFILKKPLVRIQCAGFDGFYYLVSIQDMKALLKEE